MTIRYPAVTLTLLALCVIDGGGPAVLADQAKTGASARRPAIETEDDARKIVLLIRKTFATVHQANVSGNYSVFRDLAAPSVRSSMSLVRLGEYFKPLREQDTDLSRALLTMPKFRKPPAIVKDKFLVLNGYIPGNPSRIDFNLTYQRVGGRWRFVNIAIKPGGAENGAASARSAQPDETRTAARKSPPPLPNKKPSGSAASRTPSTWVTGTTTLEKSRGPASPSGARD